MSPSSGESRRSSGSSEPYLDAPAGDGFIARLERGVAPYAQRFAEAPAVLALRESLPVALAVVALAILMLLAVQPFAGWAALAKALREAIAPAFSIAAVVMVVVLAFRLAVRLRYPAGGMVCVALLSFWFMLPRDA